MNQQIAEALAALYSEIFECNCKGMYNLKNYQYEFVSGGQYGEIKFSIDEVAVERLSIYRILVIMRNRYNEKYWEMRY